MTDLAPLEVGLLLLAGFLAGGVNAVAGGGSLISFPALLAVGLPSVAANVTNSIAVLPGYLGGSLAYRRELAGQGRRALALVITSVAGALVGALILLRSPAEVFEGLVPFLILFSCGLLALQPTLSKRIKPATRGGPSARLLALNFLASVYGGYFGAGLGIILLAVLALHLDETLQRVNALKGALSFVVGVAAAVFFAALAPVAWAAAGLMAVASFAGGQLGVRVARRLNPNALRSLVVAFGVVVAILLWL